MSGFCDIHTHVLPGIDDGARNWDESLEMIERAWKGGVRKIIATPHYLPWKDEHVSPRTIRKLCVEAQLRAEHYLGLEIEIHPGQEIFYHVDMLRELQEGKILTLGGTKHILVEFPIDVSWTQLKQVIKTVSLSPYNLILAHVERYECLRDKENIDEARQLGAQLQMNIHSLQGGMLSQTTRWCKKQLLNRKIDFLASDMHNLTSRPPTSYQDLEWIGKKLSREYQKNIFIRNALRMGV